jgi:hypothetical protein
MEHNTMPTADEAKQLAEAARVLAEFAKTAPGRLPQRVQDAIAIAAGSMEHNTDGSDGGALPAWEKRDA